MCAVQQGCQCVACRISMCSSAVCFGVMWQSVLPDTLDEVCFGVVGVNISAAASDAENVHAAARSFACSSSSCYPIKP
jgi:hypothetical protein